MTHVLAVSASQIKDWLRCHRSWHLKSVAHAPDDATAGGKYLLAGNALDEAVQLHSARMPLEVDDLAARTARATRGSFPTEELRAAAAVGISRLARIRHLLPAPKTAQVQYRYRMVVPGYEPAGAVVVVGKPDLRQPGVITDTKTTSDRGPGRGAASDRPPYALTDETTAGGNLRPLAEDVQARLYAWVEFQLDPLRVSVRADWVYVAKDTKAEWVTTTTFLRADTLSWFDRVIRPIVDEMLVAREENDSEALDANHDGCQRCFTRFSCSPFAGAQTKENLIMPLDLNQLRNRTAQAPTQVHIENVEATESLAEPIVVAINRPQLPREKIAAALDRVLGVVETTGGESESTAITLREGMAEAIPKEPGVVDTVSQTPALIVHPNPESVVPPKRGRPRKGATNAGGMPGLVARHPAAALAVTVEDYASALQSIRDLCDRTIGDLDKRIATLLAVSGGSK